MQQLRYQKSKQGFQQFHGNKEAEIVVQSPPRRKGPGKEKKKKADFQLRRRIARL